MKFSGYLLKTLHHLHRHHWGGAPLDRWLAFGLVILAGLMALRAVPGGLAGIAVCAAALLLIYITGSVAARMNYVVFQADDAAVRVSREAGVLRPEGRLRGGATGLFEVGGQEQFFTELMADFRSFEHREHALLALAPPSNFLLLGNWPDYEIGMWYMFFNSSELRRLETGQLCFGRRLRPALRLAVEQEILPEASPLDVWGGYRSGKKRKPKVLHRTIYLSFENQADRQRIIDDLLVDAAGLAI